MNFRIIYFMICVLFLLFQLVSTFDLKSKLNNNNDEDEDVLNYYHTNGQTQRSLLAVTPLTPKNCTPQAISTFPKDIFNNFQRRQGAIVLHIILSIYMFSALIIVSRDYFVPCLETITTELNLEEDVAGATFMAAGVSSPELAVTLIATFVTEDDIGLSSVVGSANYNISFIIGICALLANTSIQLNWWPFIRDSIAYTLSIIFLTIVIQDDFVFWYEGLLLVMLYILYIVILSFNRKIEKWFMNKFPSFGLTCNKENHSVGDMQLFTNDDDDDEKKMTNYGLNNEEMNITSDGGGDGGGETNDYFALLRWPKLMSEDNYKTECFTSGFISVEIYYKICCFCHILMFPLKFLLCLTIPKCQQIQWKCCLMFTFGMCCLWIILFSYLMVWMITVIGHTIGISDDVMGLTVIAAGSSLTDTISSVIVVRKGQGEMAVSNAIAGNVFDMLICIGLPWFIGGIRSQAPVTIYSHGLVYSLVTLLGLILILLISMQANGWRLTKTYGIFLLVIYVIFLIISLLIELDVFGQLSLPSCSYLD